MKIRQIVLGLTAATAMLLGMLTVGSLDAEAAGKIRKAEYDENGTVDVDFSQRARYSNPSITVKDQNGKKYTARIIDRDDDELEFRIMNYQIGKKYTFTISGIRFMSDAGYGKVSGTVSIPGGGWVRQNGKWYYYKASGKKATGWVQHKGDWYYLDKYGMMKTGWVKSGGKWYYMDRDGEMETGWERIGGKWYYFDSTGAMLSNTTRRIGRKTYKFNASGACVNA